VVPARGGDVIKLFLTKTSVPNSSYPAVGSSMVVENVFDLTMGVFILAFAFSQGVFPKPPDFAELPAFDLQFLAANPRFTLFLLTVLGILSLVGFALLSARVRAFWARVRQGFTVLFDRRRYFREVWLVQFAGWLCRFTAFWFLLEAFNVGGSVRNVLLVLGVNAVAAAVPFTPGGAGVQQALLVQVFAGAAAGATVAAYSVGQQIAIAVWTLGWASPRWSSSSASARSRRSSRPGARRARRRRPRRPDGTGVLRRGERGPPDVPPPRRQQDRRHALQEPHRRRAQRPRPVLVAAETASADSISYVKDGNVWLSTPDGSRQFQVTESGGYSSPRRPTTARSSR
jgi:hypothetical protein